MFELATLATKHLPEPIWCDADELGCKRIAVGEIHWVETFTGNPVDAQGRTIAFCASGACRRAAYRYVDAAGEVLEELPLECARA